CFLSNLLAAIRARDLKIDQVAASVTGILEGSPPRFASIGMRVSMPDADRDEAHKLIEIADRGCIMMNTLRDKLDVAVTLAGWRVVASTSFFRLLPQILLPSILFPPGPGQCVSRLMQP